MSKTIEYIEEEVKITEYKPENHFDNQKEWVTELIPLNPMLRDDFGNTPNEERDSLEVEHWWDKPYIVSSFATLTDRNYAAFVERLSKAELSDIPSEKEWIEKYTGLNMTDESFTYGVIFIVYCLDGGAWDRPTRRGHYNNLTDSILCAETLIV
jgi:hypothetical protein